MENILNVENERDQMAEADMVEGPVEGVTYEEMMKAINKMKLGKQRVFKSKYGYDNGEWKVQCYNEEALSENSGW